MVTKKKKWMVGYQEIIDCSVVVTAKDEKEAIKKAKAHTTEALNSYEQGETWKELWRHAGADLLEE